MGDDQSISGSLCWLVVDVCENGFSHLHLCNRAILSKVARVLFWFAGLELRNTMLKASYRLRCLSNRMVGSYLHWFNFCDDASFTATILHCLHYCCTWDVSHAGDGATWVSNLEIDSCLRWAKVDGCSVDANVVGLHPLFERFFLYSWGLVVHSFLFTAHFKLFPCTAAKIYNRSLMPLCVYFRCLGCFTHSLTHV